MIAYLTGTVIEQSEHRLVVDVNGVGYEVFAATGTCARCAEGETVRLHIHTQVREDAFHLYGFGDRAERDLFLLMTGVSGIGPKVALAALSALPLGELAAAIARGDVALLSRVPGVGRKTASRLALELKDKVLTIGIAPATPAAMAAGAAPEAGSPLADAVSALMNLGYTKTRSEAAIRAAAANAEGTPPVEELIRMGLAALSRGG